jgi:hypothetical protein
LLILLIQTSCFWNNYTLYDWSLKLPKGKGGFNGQTDDQDVSLKLFVQEAQAGTAALVTLKLTNVLLVLTQVVLDLMNYSDRTNTNCVILKRGGSFVTSFFYLYDS